MANHTRTATTHAQQPHMHSNHTCTATTHAQQPHTHSNHTCTATTHAQQPHMHSNHTCTANHTAKQSKKTRMLANPEIKRWYDNLARGSPITADVRLRCLGKFCEVHQMTPMELAELGMKDQGYAPGYTSGFRTRRRSPKYLHGHHCARL